MMAQRLAVLSAALGAGIFFLWHLALFLSPPTLSVAAPAADLFTREGYLPSEGSVEPETRLTLNGQVVYVDPETSRFRELLPLREGENVFVFRAEGRFGKTREVIRRVYRF